MRNHQVYLVSWFRLNSFWAAPAGMTPNSPLLCPGPSLAISPTIRRLRCLRGDDRHRGASAQVVIFRIALDQDHLLGIHIR